MATTINANTSTGLVATSDTSGVLQLQTANTTAVTIDTNATTTVNSKTGQPSFISQVNGTEAMRVDSTGNVGIGTNSPVARLQSRQDSAGGTTYAILTDNGAGGAGVNSAGIGFSNSGAMKSSITSAVYGNDYMAFNIGGSGTTERMRIDSSGNLLVGTTGLTNAGRFQIQGVSGAYASNIRVATNGDLGINFQSASNIQPGYIQVNANSVTYSTASDYRLKEDIAPMIGALDTVAQLKPVTYNWKVDGSDGQGFIAHELQAVVPDCVTGEKDAVDAEGKPVYQGIDTSFLVATLTKAIQEQQALIVQLQADVAALKGTA